MLGAICGAICVAMGGAIGGAIGGAMGGADGAIGGAIDRLNWGFIAGFKPYWYGYLQIKNCCQPQCEVYISDKLRKHSEHCGKTMKVVMHLNLILQWWQVTKLSIIIVSFMCNQITLLVSYKKG